MTPDEFAAYATKRLPANESAPLARALARVEIQGECWHCTMTPSQRYAQVADSSGKRHRAHRLSAAVEYGSLAALDATRLVIDHVASRGCQGGHCIRPDHLEVVTQRTNIRRSIGSAGDRFRRTHCPRGHALAEGNLMVAKWNKGGRACLTCSRAGAVRRQDERCGRGVRPLEHYIEDQLRRHPDVAAVALGQSEQVAA